MHFTTVHTVKHFRVQVSQCKEVLPYQIRLGFRIDGMDARGVDQYILHWRLE